MSVDKNELSIRMAKTFKAMGSLIGHSIDERKLDVHMEHLIVLEILYQEENMILQEISDRLKRDKSTVLRIIDFLERKQYVVRIPDQEDRRKKNIVLTKKGADIYEKGLAIETEVSLSVLKGLDEERLEIFSEIINVMQSNIK